MPSLTVTPAWGQVRVVGPDVDRSVPLVMVGVQGPPGAAQTTYEHTQAVPATEWIINHNFGRKVDVELFTVGGVRMLADVANVTTNQARAYFNEATAGIALAQ